MVGLKKNMIVNFRMEQIMNIKILDANKAVIHITSDTLRDNREIHHFEADFGKKTTPDRIVLSFYISCCNAFSTWSPDAGMKRVLGADFNYHKNTSRLASGAPVKSIIGIDGNNVLTVALSDAMTPMSIETGVHEETAEIEVKITLFTQLVNEMENYRVDIITDMRSVPCSECITDIISWWRTNCGYKPADGNETVISPMYSTWYSFHQKITSDSLVEQCVLARELGMKAIIIDDGWQTDDNGRGYKYCGDWKPEKSKIPDMKELVKKIHDIGMKVILWYSVPFIGTESEAYKKLSDYAVNTVFEDTITVDPRFPKVREYLISTYKNAVKEWDIDGFKLDFIDYIQMENDSPAFRDGWDTCSLEDAIDTMLSEITSELSAIKKGLCIEFRQTYIGPTICRYGNMLRVEDCGADALHQRVSMVDLRLTSGNTAVHSDMLMWNYSDTSEGAALQILNAFFTVWQISVLLDKLPPEHKKMLKFYLSLWKSYRQVILEGKISFKNPELCYTQVSVEMDGTAITAVYGDNVVDTAVDKELIVLNATGKDYIILKSDMPQKLSACIYSCEGDKESEYNFTSDGITLIRIPKSGCVKLKGEKYENN